MDQKFFEKASSIWLQGREREMNLTVGFRAFFEMPAEDKVEFRIAASTIYRFFVNGEFAGYGPARGPHGYYRVDVWDITDKLHSGRNILAVEVTGYNINSYYLLEQPSFLQVEIISNKTVLAATSPHCSTGFEAMVLSERIQKVQRYSFQRTFIEAYRLKEGYDRWRNDLTNPVNKDTCVETDTKKLIPRRLPYPEFQKISPVAYIAHGSVVTGIRPENYWKDRALVNIGEYLHGFRENELSLHISDEIQEIESNCTSREEVSYQAGEKIQYQENSFRILDFGFNLTGFIGLRLKCACNTRLLLLFDEILRNGDVDFKRIDCVNAVSLEMDKGEYVFETSEPYTLRYLKLISTAGACEVQEVYLRELAGSCTNVKLNSGNRKLDAIFDAAVRTYRQNTLDIYMDCPSRERAGWLCDSFFTSRVEFCLSGNCRVEKNFLENYALPEEFYHLPVGMLPMCYPADHNDGNFIPNWALWFVIQLEEYFHRSRDRELIDKLKNKVYGLFDYFKKFKNELGLLEKLEKWVFVEWSKANEFVQDVNAPSNMLYAGALKAASRLYHDSVMKKEAESVKDTIRRLFFNGEFFIDNAVREKSGLVITNNRTEVCQYYAFFFGIAAPDTHPVLWKTLVEYFGPHRKVTGAFPDIYPANAFIGNYLRLDILSRYGLGEKVLNEIEGYFYDMAQKTGTLWEHDGDYASCNHGFASHVAYWLLKHTNSGN